MNKYYVSDFSSADTYCAFINYMISHSDYFSLVYFSHSVSATYSTSCQKIYDDLLHAKVNVYNSNHWPLTTTLNSSNHIYRLILYRSLESIKPTLNRLHTLASWDYPDAPMDLCFYRNGVCCFASCAHEEEAYLFSDDPVEVDTLKHLGCQITLVKDVCEDRLFRLENL